MHECGPLCHTFRACSCHTRHMLRTLLAQRVWAAQKVWAAQRVWAACLRFLQDWCASLWKLPPCLLPFPAQREDAPAAAPASATSPRRPRHNTRAQTASHTAAVQAPTHRWSMNTSGRAAPRARGTPLWTSPARPCGCAAHAAAQCSSLGRTSTPTCSAGLEARCWVSNPRAPAGARASPRGHPPPATAREVCLWVTSATR
mmetsp:Transcript_5089/g.15462  ORF Transcript_5089/g.15462 Transcript_5089/m.15462 type:complete len:201 (-) Transcript_5089:603-1205(-)